MITQMIGKSGNPVRNQFIIYENDAVIFRSYKSIIAMKKGGKIYLDMNYWDYSNTTGRYRNLFLGETKKETERKIKDKVYILVDLNKEG